MTHYYIQYSDEHVHIIDETTETCFLSRNWSRCTAGRGHTLADADGECDADTAYWDGDQWRYWHEEEESFSPCVEDRSEGE
jgi:hypothetical protein